MRVISSIQRLGIALAPHGATVPLVGFNNARLIGGDLDGAFDLHRHHVRRVGLPIVGHSTDRAIRRGRAHHRHESTAAHRPDIQRIAHRGSLVRGIANIPSGISNVVADEAGKTLVQLLHDAACEGHQHDQREVFHEALLAAAGMRCAEYSGQRQRFLNIAAPRLYSANWKPRLQVVCAEISESHGIA